MSEPGHHFTPDEAAEFEAMKPKPTPLVRSPEGPAPSAICGWCAGRGYEVGRGYCPECEGTGAAPRTWMAVRKKDAEEPTEVVIGNEAHVRDWYSRASLNWTETYLCQIVEGPGSRGRAAVGDPAPPDCANSARLDDLISGYITRVAELPDRHSPEDWPDAMLVTGKELERILQDFAEELAGVTPNETERELRAEAVYYAIRNAPYCGSPEPCGGIPKCDQCLTIAAFVAERALRVPSGREQPHE